MLGRCRAVVAVGPVAVLRGGHGAGGRGGGSLALPLPVPVALALALPVLARMGVLLTAAARRAPVRALVAALLARTALVLTRAQDPLATEGTLQVIELVRLIGNCSATADTLGLRG